MLEDMTADALASALTHDEVYLIDVREEVEWRAARIPDAVLMPLSSFDPALVEVPAGKRLVLMCAGGMRSRSAAQALIAAGHDNIAHLAGGLNAWRQAGHYFEGA